MVVCAQLLHILRVCRCTTPAGSMWHLEAWRSMHAIHIESCGMLLPPSCLDAGVVSVNQTVEHNALVFGQLQQQFSMPRRAPCRPQCQYRLCVQARYSTALSRARAPPVCWRRSLLLIDQARCRSPRRGGLPTCNAASPQSLSCTAGAQDQLGCCQAHCRCRPCRCRPCCCQ